MVPLQVTLETSVTEDQIDHLGHMNVRFYGRNAQIGTTILLGRLGVDPALLDAGAAPATDVYTRHLHEQLLGAPLEVRSGVLSVDERGVRLYHELANQSDGAIAATFVHGLASDVDLGDDVLAAAAAGIVELPAHGATRSISLDQDPIATAPSLDEARERIMVLRRERAVMAEECDAAGDYIAEYAPMLIWAGEAPDGQRGDQLIDGPNGEKMAWASMESRMTVLRLPRLGDRVQAFSSMIEMRDKTMHRAQWSYDVERGELLASFETVSLAFDTVGRRAMSIPDAIRRREADERHAPA